MCKYIYIYIHMCIYIYIVWSRWCWNMGDCLSNRRASPDPGSDPKRGEDQSPGGPPVKSYLICDNFVGSSLQANYLERNAAMDESIRVNHRRARIAPRWGTALLWKLGQWPADSKSRRANRFHDAGRRTDRTLARTHRDMSARRSPGSRPVPKWSRQQALAFFGPAGQRSHTWWILGLLWVCSWLWETLQPPPRAGLPSWVMIQNLAYP